MSEDLKDRVVTNLILRGEPDGARDFLEIIEKVKANPLAVNAFER